MPARATPRILVIEDDAGVRDLVRTRLVLAGYDIHTAHNGAEGLRRVLELRPDAIVLDINMPEMDGFSVLRAMQERSAVRVPVLVLTARHAVEDVRQAISLGAKDYLTKPFSEAQLLARIGRLLRAPIPPPPAPAPPPADNSNDLLI